MKTIFLKRMLHREKSRIAIIFDYDAELINCVKSVTGIKYSGSNRFWYADDSEENLREIIRVFRDKARIDLTAIVSGSGMLPAEEVHRSPEKKVHSDNPEAHKKDISHLNNNASSGSTDKIQSNSQMPEVKHEVEISNNGHSRTASKPGSVEFRIDDRGGRLSIKFTGYYKQEWIDEIKTYGKIYYDKVHREFLIPWKKLTVDSLSDYFSSRNVEVIVIRPDVADKFKERRKDFGAEVRSRALSKEGYDGLELLKNHLNGNRYSSRTVESYLVLLELFFKYYNEKAPSEIRHNEVSDFMNDFIIKNGFSGSYQNQMISAIKLYYEISGKGKVVPYILERPRRGRALPKVFSKEEISRILNSARNSKHKLLLWMIYSCGLRRSEVTNILLTDIDRERNILHIREGKGGVDRIVPVSDKVWQKLDEYKEGYRPMKYLFEGQTGGKYSSESVYNVFKKALLSAGIKKEVGVHSLRHSYATHLHENGVDIRYIQELLGHKSTRTTEIYTHVSRRNLVAVRSPIEDLDLK